MPEAYQEHGFHARSMPGASASCEKQLCHMTLEHGFHGASFARASGTEEHHPERGRPRSVAADVSEKLIEMRDDNADEEELEVIQELVFVEGVVTVLRGRPGLPLPGVASQLSFPQPHNRYFIAPIIRRCLEAQNRRNQKKSA